VLQAHEYEPALLVHVEFAWQRCVSIVHSLISRQEVPLPV
jgi:hypothetical protein